MWKHTSWKPSSLSNPLILVLVCGLLLSCTPLSPPAESQITIFTAASPDPTRTYSTVPQTQSPTPTSLMPTQASTEAPEAQTVTPPTKTLPAHQATLYPAPPEVQNPTQYQFEVWVDYINHKLQVNETIEFFNYTPDTFLSLMLVIPPRRYAGVFSIKQITWMDGSLVSQKILKDQTLTILLLEPLEPESSIAFKIQYELNLPSIMGHTLFGFSPRPFGYTDLQTNLGDWYPFIPPYTTEQGWIFHEPAEFGEYLVYDIADYEVLIHLPAENPDLVIAASAPAQETSNGYYFSHPQARSFAWSISPYYQISLQEIELPNRDPITIASYYFASYPRVGEHLRTTTAEAVQLYSELFGPYPHDSLSIVQADFEDGMEYDGLFFLSSDYYNLYNDTQANYAVSLAAHETAHQWWYAQVGNDQALEPWLDEALCTYSERLFYEHLYPDALDWWWLYRVNYYQPGGFIDVSIYGDPSETTSYLKYRNAVYLNGALFIEDLRQLIGDQAFFSFLEYYFSHSRHQLVSKQDFFQSLSSQTSQDLTELFQNYFRP